MRFCSESSKGNDMTKKKNIFANLIPDIRNGSSHSVDFLLKEDVQDCLSVSGIRVRKFFAPLLRLVYRTQTPHKIRIDHREPLTYTKKGRTLLSITARAMILLPEPMLPVRVPTSYSAINIFRWTRPTAWVCGHMDPAGSG